MIAAFFLHNRVSAALLMRCRNAATALFSSVLGCYCRVGTLLHFDSACTATDLLLDPHASSLRNAGRMCEVGPPAQRAHLFTDSYSRRGALNGHPALRGWPAAAGTTGIKK